MEVRVNCTGDRFLSKHLAVDYFYDRFGFAALSTIGVSAAHALAALSCGSSAKLNPFVLKGLSFAEKSKTKIWLNRRR